MASFHTLEQIRDASHQELKSVASGEALASIRDRDAWTRAQSRAEAILEQAARLSVQVLTVADNSYPENLRAIPDRPMVLYVKGQLKPGRHAVACIGTRQPSSFGEKATRGIVSALVSRDWSIVSGLALGVDSIAHETAIAHKGHTVAILGNGLDAVYPKKNTALAEKILALGGALVSEQPFGAPAVPRNLVQRDRLQTGMSAGTIVMQTDLVGGSMHGVRFTLMQGRMLFVPVPQGEHRKESKSRGILALAEKTGIELTRLVKTQNDYERLLRSGYANRPVAIPIGSRDDYDEVLRALEHSCQRAPVESEVADHLTAPDTQPGLF